MGEAKLKMAEHPILHLSIVAIVTFKQHTPSICLHRL